MTLLWQPRSFLFPIGIVSALMLLTACQAGTPNISANSRADMDITANTAAVIQKSTALTPALQAVIGDYATSDYDSRAQGYDWVGVMVRPSLGSEEIDIKVRARSDIKKPSCTFDGKATLMGQDNAHGVIFQTVANDSVTFLQFKDGKLTIDAQDKYALNYFCSGGGTLAGDYQKLSGNLERS